MNIYRYMILRLTGRRYSQKEVDGSTLIIFLYWSADCGIFFSSELLAKIDTNKNNAIEFDEFLVGYETLCQILWCGFTLHLNTNNQIIQQIASSTCSSGFRGKEWKATEEERGRGNTLITAFISMCEIRFISCTPRNNTWIAIFPRENLSWLRMIVVVVNGLTGGRIGMG